MRGTIENEENLFVVLVLIRAGEYPAKNPALSGLECIDGRDRFFLGTR
jgi:hypothetical protein